MPRNSPQRTPALLLLAALVIGFFAAAPCITHAAVLTWDANGSAGAQDGSGTWTSGSGGWWNGTANVNWAAGDQAVFGAGTPGTYTISLGGAVTVGSGSAATGGLNFLTSGYTLSATSARTITVGNSSTQGVVRVVSATATIGSNVTVAKNVGTGGLALLGGGTLKVDTGGVFQAPNTNASEVAGGSTLWINGGSATFNSSVVFGQLTGGFGTSGNLLLDSGTLAVSAGNVNISRTTGDVSTVTVNGGALTMSSTAGGLNFGAASITGTSTLNLNGGSVTVKQVNYLGGTATFNFNGGTLRAQTSGSSAFMSGLTRANVRNGGAVFDSNGQSITVAQALLRSNIGGDNPIDGGLTLNDTAGTKGTLTLTGANTYTGATTLTSGTLQIGVGNVGSVGSITSSAIGTGTLAFNGGGLSSDGATARTILNPVVFTGNAGLGSATNTGTLTFSAAASLGGASRTLALASDARFDGVVSNGGLVKAGAGTLTLGSSNTFSGGLTLNAGTVVLGNAGAVNSAAGSGNAVTFGAGSTGVLALAGNSVTVRSLTTDAVPGGAVVRNANGAAVGNATLTVGNAANASSTFAGVIQDGSGGGSLGLTKAGAGSLTLSNANTYTGATTVNAGTLILSGSGSVNGSAGVTVDGAGTVFVHSSSVAMSPTVTLTQGTLTGAGVLNAVNVGAGTGGIISNNNGVPGAALSIGTLTLAGGANINLFSNSTAAGLILTTLTNNAAAGDVTITANSPGGWVNGTTYDLVSYSTLNGSGLNNFAHAVNNLTSRQSATWGDSGSAIQITVNGDIPRWVGDTNGNWNTTTADNWRLATGGGYTTFLPSDDVLFDDTAVASTVIDINAANVAPSNTTFNNNSVDFTVGSSGGFGISSGALTKNGTGLLTISSPNSYTGATTVNAGVLRATTSGSALGAGTLTLAGGTLQLANDAALGFGRDTTVTGSTQVISDRLTSGAGVTQTLGTLSIGAQTLTIGRGGNVASGTAGIAFGATTLTGSAVFDVRASSSLSLGTLATAGSAPTFTGAGAVLQTGVWSGTGGVVFAAGFTGTASLNQANTFSGGLTTNGGMVNASVAGGAGAGIATVGAGGTLNLTGGAVAYTTGLAGAGQVNVTLGTGTSTAALNNNNSGFNGALTVGAGAAAGAGRLQVNGPLGSAATVVVNPHATIFLSAAVNQAAAISLGGGDTGDSFGQLRIENSGTWSGPVTLAGAITGTGDGMVGSASTGSITGVIGETGGARGLSKAGSGTIVLSGSNTYSGTTSVVGGNLQIENAASLGSGSAIDIAATGNSALLLGNNVTAGAGKSITIRGQGAGGFFGALTTAAANTGTSTWDGGVVIGATTGTRVGSQAGLLRLTGPITEAAAGSTLTVRNDTGTTVITNGSNSFSGGTSLVFGTLLLGADGVRSGATVVSSPLGTGTFTIANAANAATVGAEGVAPRTIVNPVTFSGSPSALSVGDAVNTGKLTFTGDIDLAGASRTITSVADAQLDGVIGSSTAGSFGLTKGGAGTLTLTNAANSYAGNITISRGALRITNAGAIGTGAKTITGTAAADKWLELDGSGGDITLGPSIAFTTSGSNGVIRNVAGNNVIQGTMTMAAGNGDTRIFSDAGTLVLTGTVTAGTTSRNLNLSGTSSGTNTFSGVLTDVNTPGLRKSGATTWVVSGSNLFTGGVGVTGGVLEAASTSALGPFTATRTLTLDAGTLRYSAGSNFTQDNAAIAVGGSPTIEAATAGVTFRAGGALTGTSTGNLTIAGPGIVALGRNSATTLGSTYAGAITVASGATLDIRNADSLGDSAGSTTIQSGGTLLVNPLSQPNGVTFNAEPLAFLGASRLRNWNQAGSGTTTNTLTGPISTAGVLTISNTTAGGAARLAIAGGISGVGGVTFGGANEAGTYVLSGSNSYTGLTRIEAGRVQIAAAGSLDSTAGFVVGTATSIDAVLDLTQKGSQVSFGAGQTVSGKGTIELAAGASLAIPGLLSPGNSPGNLTVVGDLAWRPADSGYRWEINDATGAAGSAAGWDLVSLSGVLDLSLLSTGSSYALDLTTLALANTPGPMANYTAGGSYRWSLANSAGGVLLASGAAAADADVTSLFNVSFSNWQNPTPAAGSFSVRVATDGRGLDLVIVPEPSAVVLLMAAGAAAFARFRVRHKS